ncbi:MAG: alpha/beta hydrolase [bacterium]
MTVRISGFARKSIKALILAVLCFHVLGIAAVVVAVAFPNIFKRWDKYSPALVAHIPHESVEFRSRRGNTLHGWFFANPLSRQAVVLCHGRSRNKSHEMPYVRDFLKDYNVLVFDFTGHGENPYAATSIGYNESGDVLGAMDWLEGLGVREIAVVGHSMGGAAAIKAVAESGTNPVVKAVVTEGAFAELDTLLTRKVQQYCIPPTVWWPAFRIAEKVSGYSIRKNEPAQFMREVCCPVLIMQADDDWLAPEGSAKRLCENAGGISEVVTFNGRHDTPCEAVASNSLRFLMIHMPPEG